MARDDLIHVLRYFHRLGTRADGVDDTALLGRFVEHRDEAAFTALVERYGPLVWTACRRLLAHADAEDAVQAVFLVLIRRAGAIRRPELLGPWLHAAACRVAAKLRSTMARRKERPLGTDEPAPARYEPDIVWRELRPVLDEEINRLPQRQRMPFVLCYLEGMTNEQAARRLGCAPGTVKSRLARARERLRHRLTQRGIGLSGAALGAVLAEHAGAAAMPAELLSATVRLGVAFAAGMTTTAIGGSAVSLANGILQGMIMSNLKVTAILLLGLGFLGVGSGWLARQTAAEPLAPKSKPKVAAPVVPTKPDAPQAAVAGPAAAVPNGQSNHQPQTGLRLSERLKAAVQFPGIDDPRETLGEALDGLAKNYQLRFRINEKAFKFEQVPDVVKTAIADPNPIPKSDGSLEGVLEMILARIPAQSGATYLFHTDHIEITTNQFARGELNLPDGCPFPALVYEDFEDRPWSEAIRIIANRDYVSLVVDSEAAAGKAQNVRVTAQLHNVAVQTAVLALAELADMGLVRMGNVLFLTTREKAARLEKEKKVLPLDSLPANFT